MSRRTSTCIVLWRCYNRMNPGHVRRLVKAGNVPDDPRAFVWDRFGGVPLHFPEHRLAGRSVSPRERHPYLYAEFMYSSRRFLASSFSRSCSVFSMCILILFPEMMLRFTPSSEPSPSPSRLPFLRDDDFFCLCFRFFFFFFFFDDFLRSSLLLLSFDQLRL